VKKGHFLHLVQLRIKSKRSAVPRLIFFLLVLVAASFAQEAGPFGLRAGMTRKQVEQVVGERAFLSQDGDAVTYSTAPRPHPLFERYVLIFSRKYGLVMVQGVSRDIDDDKSGQSTKSECEEIDSVLTDKYGKADQGVGCQVRATCERDTWRSSVDPAHFWHVDSKRGDRVESVGLVDMIMAFVRNERGEEVVAGCRDAALGHVEWRGHVSVTYVLANYSSYQDEVKSTL
jgi:hypothetical protein